MTAAALLSDLTALGATLEADGDELVCKAPPGAIGDDIRAHLRASKPALLALLAGEAWDAERARAEYLAMVDRLDLAGSVSPAWLEVLGRLLDAEETRDRRAFACAVADFWQNRALTGRRDEEGAR